MECNSCKAVQRLQMTNTASDYECEECGQLYHRVLLDERIEDYRFARRTCERCSDQMPRCDDGGRMFAYELIATESRTM